MGRIEKIGLIPARNTLNLIVIGYRLTFQAMRFLIVDDFADGH